MFIVTAKMPRRRFILPIALAALAVVLTVVLLRGKAPDAENGSQSLRANTNDERVAYLASLGWTVDPDPIEMIRLTLPEELVEPYRSYNELQAQQGFDLTPYLGETLERCTYAVTNHPSHTHGCQADLYLRDGVIVAGDIICTGEGGYISTLEFPTGQ